MPPAAAIIAAGAIVGASAFLVGTATLAGAVALGLGTVALGFLQLGSTTTPSAPSFVGRAASRTQTLRQPITNRRLPFGEMVIGGAMTFYESTTLNSRHLMIIVLGDAPEPWDAIDIVWLDDTPIFASQMTAAGNVNSGKFSGDVIIKKHLGGPDQTADSLLLQQVSRLDSNFRGRGVAYLFVDIRWTQETFPNGLPQVRAWCRTNTVFDPRDSQRRWTPNAALILREYLTEPTNGLGFDADDLNAAQTIAAANICDEIVASRPVGHAVVNVNTGSNELRLAVAGSAAPLRLETGDRVRVFTTGSAPGGLSTGTDYYAIVTRLVGANWTSGGGTISLNASSFSGDAEAAINAGHVDNRRGPVNGIHAGIQLASSYADALDRTPVSITSAGSGTHVVIKTGEPRYAATGMVESDQTPKEAIEEILSAMAGRLVWSGGEFYIRPAAWVDPVAESFSEADLMGPLVVRTRHSRRDRFNAVRGILATQLAVGEPTDYPPVIDPTFITNDGGEKIFRDVDRPWTSRMATAQRLGKIDLARHRREKRIEFPTTLKGLRAMPGSVVKINNARRGWEDKTFEVYEQEGLEIEAEGSENMPVQGITLRMAELDATVFEFDPESDETIKAPQEIPPGGNPFNVFPPVDLILSSGTAHLFLKQDGTVVSRMHAAWTVVDGFAENSEVQFKRVADSEWETVGLIKVGVDEVQIWDVEDEQAYHVRVRTINHVGTVSDWLQETHTVEGKSAAPPDVLSFNVTRLPDGTRRFVWTANEPPDVRSGGGFQIRFAAGTSHSWGDLTPLHTGLLKTSPFESNELAAGTYTFGIKMVDSSGNESMTAIIIEATLGDPRLRNVLAGFDERQAGWPGDKVDCFIALEGILEAEGAETWDDLPNTWDELQDTWRAIVTNESPIQYTTTELDIGIEVGFTPLVSVEPGAGTTVTMQTGTESDGEATGSFVALDAVAGVRYVRFRVEATGVTPHITSMFVVLDAEIQFEDYEDIDTSASSSGRFERIDTGHFKLATRGNSAAITQAKITAFQNAGAGWTWEVIDKATTITGDSEPAAEFRIFQNGTLADATIDAEIKGPRK